ncbi:type A2 lantipeptide [Streptomyces sp. NPDC003023]|uniref:type A2 lantipeptide n=1 Tax=Streptomyces sp. NPDC003023 TaxID=3364675 RepID=UPI0036C3CD0E
MSFVPTQEIADSELDNIAGGLHSHTVDNVLAAADMIAPVSGTVATATGLVSGVTGVNAAALTGPAAGIVAGL